jgi:hypothetical protein
MRFTNAVVLAGLVAASQAFLLPPSISPTDSDVIKALPIDVAAQAKPITLDLECKDCPVLASSDTPGLTWIDGLENKLHFDFSIEHGDIDILTLNGAQIYPPQIISPKVITALQLTSDGREPKYVPLGYELVIKPVTKTGHQLDLIAIRLQIVEIGDRFVDGLESIEVQLLKSPTGMVLDVKVDTAPTTNSGGKDCTSLVCKLKSIMAEKLAGLKGLKPGMGCHKSSSAQPDYPASSGKGSHKGHHGLRPQHKHHGLRRFFHALKSIALHVLIPVFIGIAVGLAASMIGMVVGHTAVFVWRAFHGRRQRGAYCTVQRNESADDVHDDTKPFLEHQGPPPVYQDILVDEKAAL